jgi:hypothetical protein
VEFDYVYKGETSVTSGADRTDMSFSPDTKRPPTFFSGELEKSVIFREGISALHEVVVSDLRFKPKDKTAYKEWLARHEGEDMLAAVAKAPALAAEIKAVQEELTQLRGRQSTRLAPYLAARQQFFKYLYEKNKDAWFVLDPVITVHPDEVFFECFSQDESSYGRFGAGYETFKNLGEFACGTTNVDYSDALYAEFQKIRSYKTTRLEVDPSGFDVKTQNEEDFKEVKIDLPDTWVRGFLQVSSAMALGAASFDLHPMDVHNVCFHLRRKKEKKGPRALRWVLQPGKPVRVFFEPWETELVCPRSIYEGKDEAVIRIWGRRRLLILERLIPFTWRFKVHLLGKGMPSFWVADMGGLSFTLGLSGWTANDWSTQGAFDLMAPRAEVDDATKLRVFEGLKKTWFAKPDALARSLQLDRAVVLGALGAWTQAGRAIYDLAKGVYRVRELSREPLPLAKLRFASEREASANELVASGAVTIAFAGVSDVTAPATAIRGSVGRRDRSVSVALVIDTDERMIRADCQCNWHQQNQLFKGPCEHILALRMAHARRGK